MEEFLRNIWPLILGLLLGFLSVAALHSVTPEFVNSDWFGVIFIFIAIIAAVCKEKIPSVWFWPATGMLLGGFVFWLGVAELVDRISKTWGKSLDPGPLGLTGFIGGILVVAFNAIKLFGNLYDQHAKRELEERRLALEENKARRS